ncbi:MAG: sulfotransferase [Novosphingobium sp.]
MTSGAAQSPGADELLERACQTTGLDDYGDRARHAGLQAFAASLRDDTWREMSGQAREVVTDYLIHHLGNRLKLQADRKAYPEIAAQKVEKPLIIVGPPRSGSTLLHTLLSLDPDSMAPEHWLCREPSPPPGLGAPSPERLASAERVMNGIYSLIPDVFVTHPYLIEEGSGALAECGSDILNMVLTSQQMWCFWGGKTYRRYLLEADHSAALAFHREFLQHCQWRMPGRRWVLKGSDHMNWLGELAAEYPDARLIWTHRDLSQQLASLASVQAIIRGMMGRPMTSDERRGQGDLAVDLQLASIEKAMAVRERIGEEQFLDVSYHDVMASPLKTVERIHAWAGLDISPAHAARIEQWLANHHQTKHGVHRHSPEEFGLDADTINRRFAPYVERFGFGFGIRPALVE